MDVLNNKFELPLSNKELEQKQSTERINLDASVLGKEGMTFENLKEMNITNKSEQPIPSVKKKPTFTPAPKIKKAPFDVPTGPNPVGLATKESTPIPIKIEEIKKKKPKEEEKEKPVEIEEEEGKDHSKEKNIDLQFNWTAPPPGLKNMPNDASNLDMMRVGGGPTNLQGAGQQRAWSILDIFDEDDDLYSFETVKGIVNVDGKRATNTFSSTWEGIFMRDPYNEMALIQDHAPSRPSFMPRITVFNDNLLSIIRGNDSGSPVDKYDVGSASWSSYGGDLAYEHGDELAGYCIHNGELYVATNYYVYKVTSSGYTKYCDTRVEPVLASFMGGGSIYDITSDGSNIYASVGLLFDDSSKATSIYKITPSGSTLVAKLADDRYDPAPLDYESYTEKLYCGVTKPQTEIHRVETSGTSDLMMTLDDQYFYPSAATGSLFGYLSAGKKIFRLGKEDYSEIYEGNNYPDGYYEYDEQKFLDSYEENVGIGNSTKVFHTEMEGSVVRAVRRGEDSKYPT